MTGTYAYDVRWTWNAAGWRHACSCPMAAVCKHAYATAAQLLAIKDRIRARGIPCGIMCRDSTEILKRRDQGFQMLGLNSDTGLLIRGLQHALKTLTVPRQPTAEATPPRRETSRERAARRAKTERRPRR